MDWAIDLPVELMDPGEFNIPHDEWRPGQLGALLSVVDSDMEIILLEAPTGSGKSAILSATAPDPSESVRILTKTRALQAQYEAYDAMVLYGVGSYPCALFPSFFADSCAYPDNMYKCPEAEQCEYMIQRSRTINHYRQALSYAYWWAASWTKHQGVGVLACDEAHELPKLIMDHDSLEISEKQVTRYHLNPWPETVSMTIWRKRQFAEWCSDNLEILRGEIAALKEQIKNIRVEQYKARYLRRARELKDIGLNIFHTLSAFQSDPDNYWLEITDGTIIAKPLSASNSFNRAFMDITNAAKVVMTSATLGSPEMFAKTLGIPDGKFAAFQVPSNFPPESMPIYIPKKAPKMSHSLGESGIRIQANLIVDTIKGLPDNWNGIIHTASTVHAKKLKDILEIFFPGRCWIPPSGVGTEQKVAAWHERLALVPNLICISYSFHEGVDAGFANFCFLAKIPFATLDDYGEAQLKAHPHVYKWNAAVLTQQACGRIRRGEPEHYEEPGEPMRKMVAIFDNNVWSLREYYSPHFLECLTLI